MYEKRVSFPPLSKPDLMLSFMDRDAGHSSPDNGHIDNSFVFVVVLSSTSLPFLGMCDRCILRLLSQSYIDDNCQSSNHVSFKRPLKF
jgi:hypothetical protein